MLQEAKMAQRKSSFREIAPNQNLTPRFLINEQVSSPEYFHIFNNSFSKMTQGPASSFNITDDLTAVILLRENNNEKLVSF